MTDLFSSSFDASAAAPVTSQFDTSQIDRNVRSIAAVESTWRQGPLPDEVKFDLATAPGMDDVAVREFMTGLDDDLNDEALPEQTFNSRFQMPQQSGFDQARIILAGVAGNPAPQQVDSDAVLEFKRRAIRDGYLDMDSSKIDSTWSPEFNRIRSEMAYDDIQGMMRGDRYGAIPLTGGEGGQGGVMDVLNKLTSPSGLLAAATDLDLFWDFGAIGDEVSSWGDKWRKLGQSKNPFDFAKNFVDAVTGPIDDIVFPVLNWASLALGVGAAWNGARVGFQGAKLAQAGSNFGRLFNAGRIGRNLDEIGRASWTATRLLRSENTLLHGAGAAMAGYRASTPAVAIKSTVQPLMRAGILSQAEDAFPGYQGGGFELSNFDVVEDAQTGLLAAMNSPFTLPLEVLVAPYNIFTPGTFMRRAGDGLGLLNRTGSGLFTAAGTMGGRAAIGAGLGAVLGTAAGDDAGDTAKGALLGGIGGALLPTIGRGLGSQAGATAATVGAGALGGALLGDDPSDIALGALAGIGLVALPSTAKASFLSGIGQNGVTRALKGLGDGLSTLSFKALAETQEATLGFDSGMRTYLADQPERLASWEKDVQETSVLQALAKFQGGDTELAAQTIGFVFTSSALDFVATAQAGPMGTKGWWGTYHRNRNKLTNQLRQFDLDNITESTFDEIADTMAWAQRGRNGRVAVTRRARELRDQMRANPGEALELAAAHNKQAVETVRQLMHPTNVPKLADVPFGEETGIRNLLGDAFAKETTEGRAWIMRQYMANNSIFETLVDYPKYASVTGELRQARLDGLLGPSTLKPYRDRFGNFKSVSRNREPLSQPELTQIDDAIGDLALSGSITPERLAHTKIGPLASQYEPGRTTVARSDTPLKREYDELAERLRDLKAANDRWERLPTRMNWRAELKKLAPTLTEDAKVADALTAAQISQIVKTADPRAGKDLGYVLGFAQRHDLSLAEMDVYVKRAIDEVVEDAKLWKSYGFSEYAEDAERRGLFGIEGLVKRLEQVNEKARHTAAEVDVEELARYYRSIGDEASAVRVDELQTRLAEDGYKLAHGVEFLMPEDLIHGPIFGDATRRHLNAATLGNFFKGKLPIEAHIIQDRRHRLALAAELEIAPDSQDVDNILHQLRPFLQQSQNKAENLLRDVDRQPLGQRLSSRVTSAFTPLGLDDVGRSKKQIVALFAEQFGEDGALAIWRATKKFRNSDFKDVGLYGMEAAARKMNVAEWGLKTLTGSKWGDGLLARGRGLGLPAAAGAAVGVAGTDPNASFEDKLKALATGAAVGAGVAVGSRLAATGVSEAARILPGAGSLTDRSANWSYGYLGDMYARMRDAFRFTLSPVFDISRYTEGLMLAQTAAPLRRADGSRLTLNLDMSPRGLQRSIRKRVMEADPTLAKTTAARRAREIYQSRIGQFQKFARDYQDFDAEALDSTGRWFKQVGIMGFSPTDWMGTAFAHLVDEGMEQKAAYEAVRSMYTYGTKGRSAAEMSANFVFFPFSFQKKSLGHIAKWMNDDLARSIMIHDALKTYELLDQKYNLDEYWKDHIPALQQLQKLNLFAYGISPGRLGGINAQLFESTGKYAWNLFVPGAVTVGSPADAAELQKLFKQLMPAINDINTMSRNLWTEQINQVGMPGPFPFGVESHQTRNAQIRDGFAEWNEFKTQITDELAQRGYVFTDLVNKPWLADMRMVYDAKRAELRSKYPAWFDYTTDSMNDSMNLQVERRQALDLVLNEQLGGGAASAEAHMIAEYESILDGYREQLSLTTGSSDLTDAPPEVFTELLRISERFAQQNPRWLLLWERFYRRELGPISTEMELAG